MTALLAKTPKTGQPVHVRHFQIERNCIQPGKLVCELQALGKASSRGDGHLGIGGAQMAGREITAETVFIGHEKAHVIAPFPWTWAKDH